MYFLPPKAGRAMILNYELCLTSSLINDWVIDWASLFEM